MNKNDFLNELDRNLSRIPYTDKKEILNYYSEMIDDYIESGVSEVGAVNKIGNVVDVADIVLDEYRDNLIKEEATKTTKPRKLGIGVILLLVIGSPIWASLLLAALMIILSVLIVIWCIPFVLAVFTFTGIPAALFAIFSGFFAFQDGIQIGFFQIGAGVFTLGLASLSGIATINVSSYFSSSTKKFMLVLRTLLKRSGVWL